MPPARLDDHLTVTPGVCGGKPRIAGRRLTVHQIATWTGLGMEPDEIADAYDVPLASVFAALAYYHDHREAVDADLAASAAFVAGLRTRTPSVLAEKLGRRAA